MQDHPVLGQVALGYSPILDPQRAVSALRLTVFPARPDSAPAGTDLLQVIREVWPLQDEQGSPTARPSLSLNLASESLLHGVLQARPGPGLMLEVPAFMAGDLANADLLRGAQASGTVLVLKGRPITPLSAEVLACFGQCLVAPGEDRRDVMPQGPTAAAGRTVPSLQAGVTSSAEQEAAFKRGHTAFAGWPWGDALPAAGSRSALPTDVGTVMALLDGVDREDPVSKLEPVLRRDPTLAFRLMRYLNSPALGLPAEVTSFGHALTLLGYNRLKRWLALLLVSSAKGPNSKVLVYAAVRRGLLMEELGREQADSEMRGELFICGVFSLLNRLMQQPLSELLKSVPVPERVNQALRGDGGPYGPYLELVQAVELESLFDIREQTERLLLSPAVVSRAVFSALQSARELEH